MQVENVIHAFARQGVLCRDTMNLWQETIASTVKKLSNRFVRVRPW